MNGLQVAIVGAWGVIPTSRTEKADIRPVRRAAHPTRSSGPGTISYAPASSMASRDSGMSAKRTS